MPGLLQTLLRLVSPPQCILCRSHVDEDFGLCPNCWRETPFIAGLTCDGCGAPLPGAADPDDARSSLRCDTCLRHPRPWDRGRAAMLYRDNGRRLVLGLKHNDREDIAIPAAAWLARAIAPLLTPQTLLLPVPLHWSRLLKRRYNQSALLAARAARIRRCDCCLDMLIRHTRTPRLSGSSKERHALVRGKIGLNPARATLLTRYDTFLLVDDVLTSGATLGTCAEVLRNAGAQHICVAVLALASSDD